MTDKSALELIQEVRGWLLDRVPTLHGVPAFAGYGEEIAKLAEAERLIVANDTDSARELGILRAQVKAIEEGLRKITPDVALPSRAFWLRRCADSLRKARLGE